MKYIVLSLKYIYHNFFRLLVLVAIPVVLTSLTYDLAGFADIVKMMQQGQIVTFDKIYASLSTVAGRHWWLSVIAIVVFIVAMGIVMSTIDKHMRIGKFSFRVFNRLDEVLWTVLPIGLIYVVMIEVVALLASCLIFLCTLVIPSPALPTVAALVGVVMFLLWAMVAVLFMYAVPSMIVQGYRASDALGGSVRMVAKQFLSLFVCWLFPFVIVIPLLYISGMYFGHWRFFVSLVLYVFTMMYFAALAMSSYFEIMGYERHDVKKRLFK